MRVLITLNLNLSIHLSNLLGDSGGIVKSNVVSRKILVWLSYQRNYILFKMTYHFSLKLRIYYYLVSGIWPPLWWIWTKWVYINVAIIKFKISSKNGNFWKIPYPPLWAIFNDFSDEMNGDINKYNFLILYNAVYKHLENLHDSMDQYFPSDQCVICPTHEWVKDPFKVQDRPTNSF